MKLALALLLLAAPLVAQNEFYADIEGSQENPPVATSAGGWGHVVLNANDTLTYDVRTFGISATAAHIHTGVVGSNGGVLFPLSGGPTTWSGTTSALTAGQITTLRSEGLYINVHSSANPGGEIRGQVEPRSRNFAIFASGDQENPPTGSTGSGTGTLIVNAAGAFEYDFDVSGVAVTVAHIHEGAVGSNGGVFEPLAGGPTDFIGTSPVLDGDDFGKLQDDLFYANFHSATNPGGEIRGQVISSGIRYGDIDNTGLTFDIGGAPQGDAPITIELSGGAASSTGFLLVSLGPGAAVIKGAPFLLDPGALVITDILLPLDASGSLALPAVLPALTFDIDLYFQFFNLIPGGVDSSNGVRLKLRDI